MKNYHFYRPQRSWGKVILSEVCVSRILFTSGSSACWEIRATSGRYASYWNAYLFFITSEALLRRVLFGYPRQTDISPPQQNLQILMTP